MHNKIQHLYLTKLVYSLSFVLAAATVTAQTQTDSTTGLTYTIANNEATVTGIVDSSLPADGKLTIPKTLGGIPVTAIGNSAFHSNKTIKELSAVSVLQVGSNAFAVSNIGDSPLSAVFLPKVKTLETSAFFQCNALVSISLPQAKTIGNDAFSKCTHLATAFLPKVTSIGSNAFSNSSAFTKLYLGQAPSLGSNAFFNTHKDLSIYYHPNYRAYFSSGAWASLNSLEVVKPFLRPVQLGPYANGFDIKIYRIFNGVYKEDQEDWNYSLEISTDLQKWSPAESRKTRIAIYGLEGTNDNLRVDWIELDKASPTAFYRVQATPNFMSSD